MSLVPMLFSSWWESLEKPHRLFDQHFALPLSPEDLPMPAPLESNVLVLRPRYRGFHRYQPYERNLDHRYSGTSTLLADKNKFQVTLDVQQFDPKEVSVKVIGKNVVVEGKHQERQDEHGSISRQFVRKYLVPEQCNIDELQTTISSDGVLTITAPRKEPEPKQKNEKIIKIQSTGLPAVRGNTSRIEKQKDQSPTQKNVPQRGHQEGSFKSA